MFDTPRISIGILVAVCPLFAIADTPRTTEIDTAMSEVTRAAPRSPVFKAPPAEELAEITHAKIRLEILQMAIEDQLVRST